MSKRELNSAFAYCVGLRESSSRGGRWAHVTRGRADQRRETRIRSLVRPRESAAQNLRLHNLEPPSPSR
eukprot:1335370-Pleurochrysis_carterae.AAC.1